MFKKLSGITLAGLLAGSVTGFLGAGGGMVLIPMLSMHSGLKESEIFPASVAIVLPVCIVSLCFRGMQIPFRNALPYLIGSAFGGIVAGCIARKIPTVWLHRILGIFILWGGIRYLC